MLEGTNEKKARTNERKKECVNERTSERIHTDRSEETAKILRVKSVAISCEAIVFHSKESEV